MATMMAFLFAFQPSGFAQIACRYELAAEIAAPPGGLGTPSATSAAAISPNGRYVVGHYVRPFIVDDPRAFCFDMQTRQFFSLPLIDGTYVSHAYDVSDSGIVVGEIGGLAGDWGFLFDLASGQYTLLDPLHPDGICRITGINSNGTVCGTRTITGPPDYLTTAFIWSAKGGFTDLGLSNDESTSVVDINNAGFATGGLVRQNGNVTVPFIWDGSTLVTLPLMAGFSTTALRIKDDATVIGVGKLASPPISPTRGFSLHNGAMTIHQPLSGFGSCTAFDMTPERLIIGSSIPENGSVVPTIWRGEAPTPFEQLLVGTSLSISRLRSASATGLILGESLSKAVVLRTVHSAADVNQDCRVAVADLLAVIFEWGRPNSPADVDGNGTVNEQDLLLVIMNWTS